VTVAGVQGIEYVELAVTDLERSARWYEELLHFRPLPGAATGERWLDAGAGVIRLVGTGPGARSSGWVADDLQRGVRHIGLKVADVDAHAARLRAAGVPFTVEPRDATGGVRLAFFLDPDGTLLEFVAGAVRHHRTWSPELAALEEAGLPGPDDPPRFDHVAVTVGDLDVTLRFYREELRLDVVGQLFFEDERDFVITNVKAGGGVLEVFSYGVPTSPNPWAPDGDRLGVRAIGIGVDGPGGDLPTLVNDPDGIPLRLDHAG
jgi:catechol 2,3-dioxygenase-like lactoylglutathione lyase family enzyme